MVRNGIDPFVECGVKLGDDMLLPLLADKSKEDFGFFDGVLLKYFSLNVCYWDT